LLADAFIKKFESQFVAVKKLTKKPLIDLYKKDTNPSVQLLKKIIRLKMPDLQTIYMQKFADILFENDEESDVAEDDEDDKDSSDQAQDERELQTLADAFGFAKPAFSVAKARAEANDPEKKAMIFRKCTKLSSDFSGAGAAEHAANFVTAGCNGETRIETTEVSDIDSRCKEVLKEHSDAVHIRHDVFDCFPKEVVAKVHELENKQKKGESSFDKVQVLLDNSPIKLESYCHKSKKVHKFKRSHINLAGSPCINYSKANKGKQGKEGKGDSQFCKYLAYLAEQQQSLCIYIYIYRCLTRPDPSSL